MLVLKNIYRLAQDLNVQVVAEGEENIEQLNIIAKLNGTIIQGYYYSPAVNIKDFEALMNKKQIS